MEEVYILSDGSAVDISSYSQFEKTSFLMKNPTAKKQKGVAKSAVATSTKAKAQSGDLKSESGSSASQKFRLSNEADLETMQKRGILPPPSEQQNNYISDYNSLYDLDSQAKEKVTTISTEKVKLPGQRVAVKLKGKLNSSKEDINKFVENFRDNPVTGELGEDSKFKVLKLKEKIQKTDSELIHPYLYYSSANKGEEDNFVRDNFNDKELESIGINPQDFDGWLNKKGYKDDYNRKESQGLFEGEGTAFGGYNIPLAKEVAKKKLLNMYMEDMQRRDFTRQDLNQEIEVVQGNRDRKEIVQNQLFDPNGTVKYVEKNFPLLTRKLKDKDEENAKIYQESKKGGTDFFSWQTASKIGKAGWNAVLDRVNQISTSAYQTVGMEATAEGVRMLNEERQLVRPNDRGVSYVSGKSVELDGTKYIVDSKGEIYDANSNIVVTDLFNEKAYKDIVEKSKYGPSDWLFSIQGAAVQTSGVMADMIVQAAMTRGIGEFGAIASETRLALNASRETSKFTSLLNDTSKILRKIPIDRASGYSTIAQSTLGYTQGYEDTLKAARDNGINDKDAFKLAAVAAQRMAVLYAATAEINPQTNVVENIFGNKNIIKKAIEQYTKTGERGFVAYIDDIIKNTPKNIISFIEEGGKEVVQENIQQAGEIGVNIMTNRQANKKIMNEVMTADDFMNTSILSFVSSGLISKAKMPSFLDGNNFVDDLTSLNTLAENKKEFTKIIDNLVVEKVFTLDQVNNLKKDVDVYTNNVNKLPKNVTPDAAMPIMRELDKVTKLTDEKQTVDKAFHGQIDEKIEAIRTNINKIFYESELKVKNEAIEKAIKKGVAKGISMKSFSTTEEVQSYLVNEIGMSEEAADVYLAQPGFALNSETLKEYSKDPNSISDKSQVIVVNESRTKDAGVIQHEFLHGVLQNTLKDSPEAQKLVGVALSQELNKIQESISKNGYKGTTMPVELKERLGQYADRAEEQQNKSAARLQAEIMFADGDESKIAQAKAEHEDYVARVVGVQWEEMLTVYSDILRGGYVTYNESTFTKLGDILRRALQYLGIKDIKFESGKDVYNFIKDYNSSVESGNWGKALTKMSNKGAKINIKPEGEKKVETVKPKVGSTFSTTEKFSLSERKSSEDIKKDINKGYDKEKWSAGTNDKNENRAIDKVLYDILNEYEYIIKGKAKVLGYANLPDYSEIDMISETQFELIPHIRNFNKEFFQKREEYKKELIDKGLKPDSKEFKDKVEAQDLKGYQGKKGIVKENNDLNAWINSQLVNKMGNALRSGNVTTQKFTEDIDNEMFKESKITDGFGGEEGYLMDEGNTLFDAEQDYAEEQNRLVVLLKDPVFRFVDEQGKPIDAETVPLGGDYITGASDPTVAANKKLLTETDPAKIVELKKELKDLERGLELQVKKDNDEITPEEVKELKSLKSFKSYNLNTLRTEKTFKALSVQDTPARIVTEEVAREILRSPNIETLEYRNFKEILSDMSKTMARRMTFKNGPEIESLMYREWQLLYDVINHPLDTVTDQSSYSSKKIPPTLKMFDEQGNRQKIKDITRIKFLQAFYEIEDVTRIVKTYGGENADKQLNKLEPREINPQTGKKLSQNAHFDRRTALMELFGDVMVLQEARRLIRHPEFLSRIAEENVNLYNDLKNDVIRTKVLNDMAKGKSDIVKFSLAEAGDSPTPNITESLKYKSLIKTGQALNNNIANNILFGYESLPKFDNVIKFSLYELDDNKSQLATGLKDVNKKYENNFKFPSNITNSGLPTGYNGKEEFVRAKNYYIRTLQYSDVTDTIPGTKLHTFKTYEEVENEVVVRIKEIINSMTIFPSRVYPGDEYYIDETTGEVDKDFKDNSKVNPFVIEGYKDDYIDAMLQKSIDKQDSRYIDYWTEVKNDSIFRENEIQTTKTKQWWALNDLAETIYDYTSIYHNGVKLESSSESANGLMFNPFFTYLFLKDVLSSKYITNVDTESSERKSFKKSEYKTTLAPIDAYMSLIIKETYEDYSDMKTPPGMVYSLLNIKYGKTFVKDWEDNRKISELDNVSIFKFKQTSGQANDAYSLNRLAANNTNTDGLWCTGQRVTDARDQLSKGDFFIGANKVYKPIVAVRLDNEDGDWGVGEVVGTGFGQVCRVKDFPIISKIFLESDLENKENFANLFTVMHDVFVNDGKNSFKNTSNQENEKTLKDISRMIRESFFRLELDVKDKISLVKKLKIVKLELIEKGLHTDVFDLGSFVEHGSVNVLNITPENASLLEEQVKITETELAIEESEEGSIDIQVVNKDNEILKHHFELPLLEEINSVIFSGVTKFTAKELEWGNVLFLNGEVDTSFDGGYLELNESINFDVDVDVNLIKDANSFTLSDKNIYFNDRTLSLKTRFNISEDVLIEEGTSIDISTVQNASTIYLDGFAEVIDMPYMIDELTLSEPDNKIIGQSDDVVFLGTETINKLFVHVRPDKSDEKMTITINGVKRSYRLKNFNVNDFNFANKDTSIGMTVFLVKEKPTDKFIQDILKSEIGLLSSTVSIRKSSSNRDENGILQFEDYILDIKKPTTDIIKFSLAETKEDIDYKDKFKNLINSKEYTEFYSKLKGQQLHHIGSKSVEGTIEKDEVRAIWFYVDFDDAQESQYVKNDGKRVFEPLYGDGVVYETTGTDLPGAIIIPDIELAGGDFFLMINKKYPKAIKQILKNKKSSKVITQAGRTWTGKQSTHWRTNRLQNGKESEKFLVVGLRDILDTDYADEILNFWMKYISNPPKEHFNGLSRDDVGLYEDGKVAEGIEVIAFGKMKTQNEIKKLRENGKFDLIKFSLAEEENGRLSNFLEGLPFSEQWLVARDIVKAVEKAKTATTAENSESELILEQIKKLKDKEDLVSKKRIKDLQEKLLKINRGQITFKVPSMSKSSDKAIAYLIISKTAEGYNNFEFKVKKNASGPLTSQVLSVLDFKSSKVQERIRLNNNLEEGMNKIIEENKGVKADETFSPETAKNLGKNIGKNELFLPSEDEDFLGLLYTLASGKGEQGEEQLDFLKDNLLKPYSDAMLNLMKARQTMYKDWRDLVNKKHKGISKILKQDSGYGGYLIDQAVRVYLWKKAGYTIPGLDNKDIFHLRRIVLSDPRLRAFADDVSYLSKQANGYIEPGHNWGLGSIVGDMNDIISKSNRKKYLEHWKSNVDKIFSKQNLAKIEALYGRNYVQSLNNMLDRMQTGTNRAEGASDAMLNWINGSTAVVMFLNMRSAILQTISSINFLNTSDNNIFKAGVAFLNAKQYMEDMKTIWNSDYLKDRRSGLMNDVAEAELAQLMNDPRNNSILDKFKAGTYWILKQGFAPTRVADSFAIAFGGAGFYRNRLNTYKKKGMSDEDAKTATMRDFYEISETSQQSADVSKISKNQASTKGRLLLSFLNTPFQYSRIIKKSTIDLIKGRGSVVNNVSKILYYSVIQNIMFNFMQNALFAIIWDDEDEQAEGKFDTAKMRAVSGTMDTLLRGSGMKGVILASVKNVLIKWYEKSGDPNGYGDVLLEMMNISPSIGIKARSVVKSYKAIEYNKDEIMYKGFSLDNNYAIEAVTSLTSAVANIPLDRLYVKTQNIQNALNSDYETWQRIFSALGYTKYNLGIEEIKPGTGSSKSGLKKPGLNKPNSLKKPSGLK